VSVRTFFRYFPGKEEVALAPLDEVGELTLAALRRRPADEPPLVALRAATLDAWTMMSPDGYSLRHYAEHLLPLGGSSPLAGAVLNRVVGIGDRLADELTENFDPPGTSAPAVPGPLAPASHAAGTADHRPVTPLDAQLSVVTFLAALQVAVRSWCSSDSTDLDDLLATAEACLARLSLRPASAG
jgi:AcrR family transcriptional regulator